MFSVTAFVLFLALDFLFGIRVIAGEGHVFAILAIWLVALVVAFGLTFVGGYDRVGRWRSAE